jgi:hypothetical protein
MASKSPRIIADLAVEGVHSVLAYFVNGADNFGYTLQANVPEGNYRVALIIEASGGTPDQQAGTATASVSWDDPVAGAQEKQLASAVVPASTSAPAVDSGVLVLRVVDGSNVSLKVADSLSPSLFFNLYAILEEL